MSLPPIFATLDGTVELQLSAVPAATLDAAFAPVRDLDIEVTLLRDNGQALVDFTSTRGGICPQAVAVLNHALREVPRARPVAGILTFCCDGCAPLVYALDQDGQFHDREILGRTL